MHPIQKAILQLFENTKSIPLKLRWIAREVGEEHPQKIKYHLHKLEKMGAVAMDLDKKEIIKGNSNTTEEPFVSLPVMGAANCGVATALAEDRIEGFLKISRSLLFGNNSNKLFVLKATGDSMNDLSDSKLEGKNIEDGDYVIVEKTDQMPANKDIVVSIIDGCANIKRFFHQGSEIALISESKHEYPPIFIHEDDSCYIAGKVIKVIKRPKFN
jgi:repressor LexA